MNGITLRQLRRRSLPAAQAAALVAGVIDELTARAQKGVGAAVPSDDEIALGPSGQITFTKPVASATAPSVAALAGLLRTLLNLDGSAPPSPVPGSLMVLLARSLGEIDLPAPSVATFRRELDRIAPDPARVR